MENYTLNRFYFEAKALLEKYGIAGKENYELQVEFQIEDKNNTAPNLHFTIKYCPIKFDSTEESYYGFGCTPVICINSFEETLLKASGKILIERLSVDLQ